MKDDIPPEWKWREEWGLHLYHILDEKGLTTHRAARESGIGDTTLRSYLDGTHTATLYRAVRLARYLGISLDELVGLNSQEIHRL